MKTGVYGGRVAEIIAKSYPRPVERHFRPVVNPELYFRDLEKNGTNTTELRRLQAKYETNEEQIEIQKIKYDVPDYLDHIPVHLDVKKGRVKIRICSEMANLYDKFYSKGIKPKIEERIKALKTFGYPDEVLLDVLKKDEKRVKDEPVLEEFINTIFGEFSDKRPSAPKKKNLYQVLKIRKYAAPTDEYADEEEPVSENGDPPEEEEPVEEEEHIEDDVVL